MYVLERFSKISGNVDFTAPGMKAKFAMEVGSQKEKSQYTYITVLNEKADTVETMKHVFELVHKSFEIGVKQNHQVFVGDAKTYDYIMKLKVEYGQLLDWVIPYPGDWHVLKNYQEVLMKIFWDAGLKEITNNVHKAASSKIQSCSIFKRTHRLLLQVFEALYMFQIQTFIQHRQNCSDDLYKCKFSSDAVLDKITNVVNALKTDSGNVSFEYENLKDFLKKQDEILSSLIPDFSCDFKAFCSQMSSKCKTFKFWDRLLKVECFAYIELLDCHTFWKLDPQTECTEKYGANFSCV